MVLVGYSAVRQESNTSDADSGLDSGSFEEPIGGGDPFGGGVPQESGGEVPSTPKDPEDVFNSWSTALVAAGNLLLQWMGLSVILIEASLLSGKRPTLGKNFQIAVWASLPLALMALLQIIYMMAGGQIKADGLSGLLSEWKAYDDLPDFWRNAALSLSSRLTLFWLWTLSLIYFGARYGLKSRTVGAFLAIVIWVIALTVIPVLTGDMDADALSDTTSDTVDSEQPTDFIPEEPIFEEPVIDNEFGEPSSENNLDNPDVRTIENGMIP
jgi:hypothetical protein